MKELLPALALLAAEAVHFYPLMPERMSSHYGWSGVVNGWMSRPAFFAMLAGTVGGVLALFFALA